MVTSYSLMPAQDKFLHVQDENIDVDICLYQGGFGSGKSWVGTLLGTLLALKYPGSQGLVGALTYKLLHDATKKSYFNHFDSMGWEYGTHYRFLKQESKFELANGSVIFLRQLNEFERIRSTEFAWAHLEEASLLPGGAIDEVIGRLRWPNISPYRLFLTTNPEASKGWMSEMFRGDRIEEIASDRNDKVTRIAYRKVIAPSTENIHLSDSFLATLKSQYDDEYYRIFVLGQDGDYTAGLVVKNFSGENIQPIELNEHNRIHIACDFNVDPCMWVVSHINPYRVFDEIVLDNTTIVEMVDEFAKRYPPEVIKAGITINGDASGSNRNVNTSTRNANSYTIMRNRLSELGYRDVALRVPNSNPLIEDRIAAFNGQIKDADGNVKLTIDPKCKKLIYNLENLKYIEGTSALDLPTPRQITQDKQLKYLGHIFDAVSYLTWAYNPLPVKDAKQQRGVIQRPFTPTKKYGLR